MTPEPADHPAITPVLRWFSKLMCLPELCGRAKCRRAHTCRGEPHKCLVRYAPLVPEEAREGVKRMLDGRERGLSFDEVHEEFVEVDDLIDWQTLVRGCAKRAHSM